MDRNEVIRLILNDITQKINELSNTDLAKYIDNTHSVNIVFERIKKKSTLSSSLTEDKIKMLIIQLNNLSSRDEGIDLLHKYLKTKKDTELFAKSVQVSFLKQDKKEYIINKIVESTIGARLRSNAINNN